MAAAVFTAAAAPLRAQIPEPPDVLRENGPRTQIMLLGTYHFRYNEDVLRSAEGRAQIEDVVARLAAFAPTKIALEFTTDRQTEIDSLYALYLDDRWELGSNEVYQLGFRLARRLGHRRVHLVDTERHPFFVDLALEELAPREDEIKRIDPEWTARFRKLGTFSDSLFRVQTLGEYLRFVNSPAQIRRSHLVYHVRTFKFDGEEGGFLGADFTSGWYNRNLRIFRNLQRITESPDDRILLIIGYGHLPILRFVVEHSPEFELVEAETVLAPKP